MPAQYLRRQQRGGDHAVGQPPAPEARRDVEMRRRGAVAPDVGHIIQRHAVLRRPRARLPRVGEPQLCLCPQSLVAVAVVFAAAVQPAAEDQRVAPLLEAPALRVGVEVPAVDARRAGQLQQIRLLLPQLEMVEAPAREHGVARGDDDLRRLDAAAVAADGVAADVADRGVLVHVQPRQQRREQRQRRKARLLRKAQRLPHGKGEVRHRLQLRVHAQPPRGGQLARQLRSVGGGVDAGDLLRQAAVRAPRRDQVAVLLHGVELRHDVLPRQVFAEIAEQPLAEQPVLGAEPRGHAARGAAQQPVLLQQHHPQPRVAEGGGGQYPRHAAADDGDVGDEVFGEPRVRGQRGVCLHADASRCFC